MKEKKASTGHSIKRQVQRFDPGYRRSRWLKENIDASTQEVQQKLDGIEREIAVLKDEERTNVSLVEQLTSKLDVDSAVLTQLSNNVIRSLNTASLQGGRKIRVLFLVHNIEIWTTLFPVYKKMSKDKMFKVMVASCQRRYPSSEILQGEDIVSAGLDSDDIEHVRFISQDGVRDLRTVMRFNPDIIFRQSKWDNDLPSAFSVDNLTFSHLYYIPYGIMPLSGHSFEDGMSHDLEHDADGMFVTNEEIAELYREGDMSRKKRFIPTGNPRIDYIRDTKPKWPINSKSNFKIIWSPHHSIFTGWNDFGTFLSIYSPMLTYAREHPDTDILLSMHPGLKGAFERLEREDKEEYKKIQKFLRDWKALPNTGILENGGYIPAMKASDMCITDGLSLLIEYQLTNKPLVFIEREGHAAFSPLGERMSTGWHTVPSDNFSQIKDKIAHFKAGEKHELDTAQKKNIDFLCQCRKAADSIVETIKKDLGRS